ncbi:MAG: OsmC family protein [Candidatus Cloacimonadota bacterium]|nr:OsmC family protein [Candidatus Cloacimonadota bacterium]
MATMKKVKTEARLLDKMKIEVTARGHKLYVDQPQNGGGEDSGPTPLEYLFFSLASCIATIGKLIALRKRIELRGINVEIEGELDLDVLMGKSKANRAGFQDIKVITDIDADMSKEEKENFLHEIDQLCPISDNIANNTAIKFEIK